MTVVSSSCLKNVGAQVQQVVERLEELRAGVGGAQAWHRAALEPQTVVVVVLVVAADDAQPVLLVLDVAPEQVVQRPQRIDLQVGQRIVRRRRRGRSGSAA